MSRQRKRGHTLIVYPAVASTDARGHTVWVADMDHPVPIRGAVRPDRSSRMEVPGQQQIRRAFLTCDLDAPVRMWARLSWDGLMWDVAAPPDRHYGPRATAHLTVAIKERTNS
jgi:hypothetical protein